MPSRAQCALMYRDFHLTCARVRDATGENGKTAFAGVRAVERLLRLPFDVAPTSAAAAVAVFELMLPSGGGKLWSHAPSHRSGWHATRRESMLHVSSPTSPSPPTSAASFT